MKLKYTIISLISVLAIGGIVILGMYFSYNNKHVGYHNQYDAQVGVVETRLDNMWKIISDKFSMSQEYANDFKEVAKINATNFGQGGEMWKWVQATYPQIDATVYKEVMSTIESERKGLENAQKRIIDIAREHNNLVMMVPGKWFISDQTPLEWVVISSKESKTIMITHEDERTLNTLKN